MIWVMIAVCLTLFWHHPPNVSADNWSPPDPGQAKYWCGMDSPTGLNGMDVTCSSDSTFNLYHITYFPVRSKLFGTSGNPRLFTIDMANAQIIKVEVTWSGGIAKKIIFDPYTYRKLYFLAESGLIRSMDMAASGTVTPVTEIGGGAAAPVCIGTACAIGFVSSYGGFRIVNRRVFIPDPVNNRIIRGTLSEKIMSTLVSIIKPFYLAYYKGYLWVTKQATHYGLARTNAFTGDLVQPALGLLNAATTLTHTNTRDIEVDCARKAMYIPEVNLDRLVRYDFVTRVHETIVGTGTASYNGPGPLAGTSYNADSVITTAVIQNTLIFFGNGGNRRLHMYGLSSSSSQGGVCITQSVSRTQVVDKNGKAWRFYGDPSVTSVQGEGVLAKSSPASISAVSIAYMAVNPVNKDLLSLSGSSTSCRAQKVAYYRGTVNTLIGPTATEQCSTVDHASSPTTARIQPGTGMVFAVVDTSTKRLFFAQLAASYCGIRYMDLVTSAVGAYAVQSSCTDGSSNVVRTAASFAQVQGLEYKRKVIYFGNVGQALVGRISLASEVYTTATVAGSCPNCQSVQIFRSRMYFTGLQRHTIDYVDLAYPETVVTWLGLVNTPGNSVTSPVQFNTIFNLHLACQRRSIFVTESVGNVVKEITLGG
eukprot:PhF_6_TR10601/c0_g1_i5/m.17077